ncbi:MAG TPA: hypothetical protein VHO47_05470 [Candidatus Babeliales bacterium]|nr:hypothetical protein [Candidatus Babeliales bacterium]
MKKIVVGILLSISVLQADDAQIEANFRLLSKELDELRASGNNSAASQESFDAYTALLGFCEKQLPIPEKALKKLKKLNCVDENRNMRPNVCSIIQRVIEEAEVEQKN